MNSDEAKISTELNLSLQIPYGERTKSLDLNVGYNENFNSWELIIRYTGSLLKISSEVGFTYKELLNGYAVINIREEKIGALTRHPSVIFIEKPKTIYMEKNDKTNHAYETARRGYISGFAEACMEFSRSYDVSLTGKGVLVAVIDSGIDITHPEFIKEDGSTRIINLWDQSLSDGEGKPGAVYTADDINKMLRGDNSDIPIKDTSGHGTAVAGVVASCVPDADLLIVKLNPDASDTFSKTTSLMLAIDYSVRYATEYNRPLVINLSFGNNYGSHDGNSVLEDYIDSLSGIARLAISVGTGNDGNTKRHVRRNLTAKKEERTELLVPEYTTAINIQIWRSYSDDFSISLTTPKKETLGTFSRYSEVMSYELSDMYVQAINGYPTPINKKQETYIAIIPKSSYIETGVWTVNATAGPLITDGTLDMWLPVSQGTSADVGFLAPSPEVSLTIPSSAGSVISVGAYNQNTLSYAPFSGRGYTADGVIKPEISAPGVDIDVPVPNGGYAKASGTSFATPFAAAACAMLMQWGIVNGNDPYLYGEKLKAYLIKGAKRLTAYDKWPNEMLGYGTLCVRDSLF